MFPGVSLCTRGVPQIDCFSTWSNQTETTVYFFFKHRLTKWLYWNYYIIILVMQWCKERRGEINCDYSLLFVGFETLVDLYIILIIFLSLYSHCTNSKWVDPNSRPYILVAQFISIQRLPGHKFISPIELHKSQWGHSVCNSSLCGLNLSEGKLLVLFFELSTYIV